MKNLWPVYKKPRKISFLGQNVYYWNQYKKMDFLIPHSTYSRNFFSSHREIIVYFSWTKKSKSQATNQYFVKRFFYKQVLDFHRPSNFYAKPLGPTQQAVFAAAFQSLALSREDFFKLKLFYRKLIFLLPLNM